MFDEVSGSHPFRRATGPQASQFKQQASMAKKSEVFAVDELEAIANVLGDMSEVLAESEISYILLLAKKHDVGPQATKWKCIDICQIRIRC